MTLSDENAVRLGDCLRQIRKHRGLSQEEWAHELAYSRSAVAKYEQGAAKAGTDFVDKAIAHSGLDKNGYLALEARVLARGYVPGELATADQVRFLVASRPSMTNDEVPSLSGGEAPSPLTPNAKRPSSFDPRLWDVTTPETGRQSHYEALADYSLDRLAAIAPRTELIRRIENSEGLTLEEQKEAIRRLGKHLDYFDFSPGFIPQAWDVGRFFRRILQSPNPRYIPLYRAIIESYVESEYKADAYDFPVRDSILYAIERVERIAGHDEANTLRKIFWSGATS